MGEESFLKIHCEGRAVTMSSDLIQKATMQKIELKKGFCYKRECEQINHTASMV